MLEGHAAVVLTEDLNFTRAAHHLQITQPAVSKHITDLEKRHGFKLFLGDRKKTARLTEAGRALVSTGWFALFHTNRAIHLAWAAHDRSCRRNSKVDNIVGTPAKTQARSKRRGSKVQPRSSGGEPNRLPLLTCGLC